MAHDLYWAEPRALDNLKRAFVKAWRGDTEAAAKDLGIPLNVARVWVGEDWFADCIAALAEPTPEADIVKDHVRLLREEPADRTELLAFWTRVLNDPKVDLDTKLKASKLLADAQGVQAASKVEVTGAEGGPIQVEKVSLAERVALLAVKAQAAGQPLPDFLA